MENYKEIIADNLKRLRKERKLSLEKVSTLTSISKSMLSQIEKGTANPSISTLWKLANGFKISFTELINAPEKEVEIIKLKDKIPLTEDERKYRNFPIVLFDPIKRFETYHIEIDPSGYLVAEPHPEGTQEYVTVTKGNLCIQVNEKKYRLKQGDTLRFKANVSHSYKNEENELCTLSMLLYYPEKNN